ncbi:hypothetical protein KP509_17G054100 [Ceratopteris richardii]|uniref:Uncharacterized protein n=1 Tax=Ceratopteris richardii TaxID=49495 RepID=A0A8T2SWA9_CERRI|nr:hypothetical protein KP509_17G054100 [Ceratopteris richardii]
MEWALIVYPLQNVHNKSGFSMEDSTASKLQAAADGRAGTRRRRWMPTCQSHHQEYVINKGSRALVIRNLAATRFSSRASAAAESRARQLGLQFAPELGRQMEGNSTPPAELRLKWAAESVVANWEALSTPRRSGGVT